MRAAVRISDSAQVVAHRMDLAMRLGACASERALGVSPARTAKAFRPGSRGGVHAHFWMMRFPTRFAVTCQAKKRASALSVQPGAQSIFSASAWTTGVQSAASDAGTAGNARSSARRDHTRPQRKPTPPSMANSGHQRKIQSEMVSVGLLNRRRARRSRPARSFGAIRPRWTTRGFRSSSSFCGPDRGGPSFRPKKSCGFAEPNGGSNVAPKVGGIPVMPAVRGH